jgi:hypothetical protein
MEFHWDFDRVGRQIKAIQVIEKSYNIPLLHVEDIVPGEGITSLYVTRSQYLAFFGKSSFKFQPRSTSPTTPTPKPENVVLMNTTAEDIISKYLGRNKCQLENNYK